MRSSCVEATRGDSRFHRIVAVLMALLFALAFAMPAEAARKKKRQVKAYNPPYAAFVIDVNTGRVLHDTHSTALRHPASVTKVMTLYMLFEQMERGRFTMNSELRVSSEAARQAPSKLGLRAGTTISVEDAIKALITKSANDVAVVVAEAVAGDVETFAEQMTRKARSIGMTRTVFRNPSGLPDPEQVTTARDLATLGRAIQDRFPRQYSLFQTRNFEYDGWVYRNHNRLLGKVEGVDGIKTGFTRASGFNLLTSAKSDGRHIITVVLGGRSARARDVQVASLVETHLPRAVAGRRTPRTVEVAQAEVERPATPERPSAAVQQPRDLPAPRAATVPVPPATVAQVEAPRTSALPAPPARPRPAVIAETPVQADPGLTRARPLALASTGTGGTVQAAANPLALVGTTPRSPAQRLQPTQDLPPAREARLVPPGSVRYTNSLPTTPVDADERQPLPKTSDPALQKPEGKVETRVVQSQPIAAPLMQTPARPAPAVAETRPTPPAATAVAAPRPAQVSAAPAPAPTPRAATPAPRSGWVIQLAAADSETKARGILDSAIAKHRGLLSDAKPFTETVTKGNATLFRARFAGFDAAEEANKACNALKRTGFNCFAQRI
jgi:D-alanyl-D-alanine carboxypeptidase